MNLAGMKSTNVLGVFLNRVVVAWISRIINESWVVLLLIRQVFVNAELTHLILEGIEMTLSVMNPISTLKPPAAVTLLTITIRCERKCRCKQKYPQESAHGISRD